MRKALKLQNLDCANCAAKMESDISALEGVTKASISFMTQKLMLDVDGDAQAFDAVLDKAQAICAKYEPDCVIVR